ncbi:MAG: MotA/TolQ/ExbB proton channel family protein [Treponema sp.]|nr:MotA/TolQ/ExbB proton channel family protein [Treponema sp.]
MLEAIKAGGLLMIPIIICGIVATFIIIERCYYFYMIKKRDRELILHLNDAFVSKDLTAAESACVEAGTPTAQVIKRALEYKRLPEKDLREIVSAKMDSVVPNLEHLLTPLGTIANVATLFGLLGTVTGNIRAFGVLGAGGTMGNPALLANAIAEALVTTVAGLSVSIPAVIFHNYFVSVVNRRLTEMQSAVTTVLVRLSGRVL